MGDVSVVLGEDQTVLHTLLQVAVHRLKPNGRLVFWYPSVLGVKRNEILRHLEALLAKTQATNCLLTGEVSSGLRVVSVGREMLSSMWRWMCVLERVEQ